MAWISIFLSLISCAMLLLKNNNIYGDYIKRKIAERNDQIRNRRSGASPSCWNNLKWFSEDKLHVLKLYSKYTLLQVLKSMPSILFRIFSYCIIISYSAELYTGIGYLAPLVFMVLVVLAEFLVGKVMELRNEEAIVNAFCGVTLPIYLDIFPIVSIMMLC